jgi:hypothetical protein
MKKLFMICSIVFCLGYFNTQAQPAANPDMQEAMKALGMMMSGGASNNQAAISQSQIKALLPTEFNGMKRTSAEAGKNAAMGMNITYATATYGKGDSSIQIKISDISAMGQFMKMAQFAWTQTEMERETDRGYERTSKIDGFPAKERYENEGKSGEVEVMVDGRFMVQVNGYGIEMDHMLGLIKTVDLKKLVELKPEAAAAQ